MTSTKRPDELNHEAIEIVRKAAFALRPAEQYRVAAFVAENVGYVLAREPDHPESPHTPANESPAPQADALDNAAFQNTDNASPIAVLAAVRHCANSWEGSARLLGNVRASDISRACDHAIKNLLSPDPQAIGRDNPFIAVLASLAAAISLLERTPKAKKAAASDKMFNQMIVDYKKALEAGRAAALASPAPQPPVEGLRALERLEAACETLAATRPVAAYCAMIDGGQADALLELDAARKLARAALASPSLTAGWQPIDTAPKDGTEINGYRPDQGVFTFRWAFMDELVSHDQNGDPVEDFNDHEGWWHDRWGWMEGELTPTHWQPLPATPPLHTDAVALSRATGGDA